MFNLCQFPDKTNSNQTPFGLHPHTVGISNLLKVAYFAAAHNLQFAWQLSS